MAERIKGFFSLLVELSGLTRSEAEKEFKHLFEKLNICPETMDLNELRTLLMTYLDEHLDILPKDNNSFLPLEDFDPAEA